ncbi:anti-sigma-K factor RskA [Microbacterium sp. CH12i]|uniref:anti-sigma factor n=1 Tax=Microbacterium sp. CH12i TaxID=1479651 RepID=UPI000461850F|nr:anti-sigma factor [Microbacterium sp. CH12i]KDA05912.1 anti-sigma-K factor RskA [Microbacterium sp. CH12i]
MNEQEFSELAAGHALRALSDADEQSFADALAAHPEWEQAAQIDERTVALLAESVAPVAPPPTLHDALLAQITNMPQQSADEVSDVASAPATPSPRRWGRILFALAASVALLVGIGVGVSVLGSQLTRPESVVALEQIESSADAQQASIELESGATATAHWSPSVGNVVLVTDGLDNLDAGRTYELWFVRGAEPVSAGVFEADAGKATALLDGKMRAGDVIAVTVEQAGGSPSGQPTTDPIIVIPTA